MGPRAGSKSTNFSGISCFFFIFYQIFWNWSLKYHRSGPQNISFQFLPMASSIESINLFYQGQGGKCLNCNATHQILRVFSPAENKIQLFGIQKLFLSQYFLHCLVCLSERQFSDERFCLTRKYLLSPAAPFILDANVFQSQYCYNISHLSTSPQDKYTKVGNTAYNS